MDAFTATHHLASRVQEIHLLTQAYLGNLDRNPLHLTAYLASIRNLLKDLQDNVLGRVPDAVFATHWQNTVHLEEALLALEAGYVRNAAGEGLLRDALVNIDEEELRNMVDLEFTDKEVAQLLHCSVKTVYRKRKQLGLKKYALQHTTPDDILKQHIIRWWNASDRERIGSKMTFGWLKAERIPCTRRQVRAVLKDLRTEYNIERRYQPIRRRDYHAPFVNSLWHIDGNHKLINWKFVIHGGIDGHSHLVTFLAVSDNNRASTVRRLFVEGAERWGWPSRVRADYGGENLGVKQIMEATRGLDRGSFITGKSVHNQRIERLWRDLRNGVVRKFAELFRRMEGEGYLDRNSPVHLYCLHYVFLPMIQHSLQEWVKAWNHHHMSTPGLQNRSPIKQYWFSRALAEQAGFHLDFFPDGREVEQEDRMYERINQLPPIDVAQYELFQNGEQEVRDPQEQDPHVVVYRFADDLPDELYSPAFFATLQHEAPTTPTMTNEQAVMTYVNCLDFVERSFEAEAPPFDGEM